jgi:hypothetical protein
VRRVGGCSQKVQKLEQRVQAGEPVSKMVYRLRLTGAGLRTAGEFLVE